MTEQELQAIEARANAASEGPWESHYGECGGYDSMTDAVFVDRDGRETYIATLDLSSYGQLACDPPSTSARAAAEADAAFIAHAREDVPALIAEVRRLQARQKPYLWTCPTCGVGTDGVVACGHVDRSSEPG